MIEDRHTLSEGLRPYVKRIWYSDGYVPQSPVERVLPSGAVQLIINLGSDRFRHFENGEPRRPIEYPNAIITGIHTRHLFLDSYSRTETVGVVLKPGAVAAILRTPAGAFQDQVVSLLDFRESELSQLRERLIEAAAPRDKFELVEAFLSQHLDFKIRPNKAVVHAVRQIERCHGTKPISEILTEIGYSRRWFGALFRETVGVTPKVYARIRRFQNVVRRIRHDADRGWSEMALNAGYFDQSHFISEFKDFSGITPVQYAAHDGEQMNHLVA